jgi:hypothetical protein
LTVDDEALEQVQELRLAAGQVAVLADDWSKASLTVSGFKSGCSGSGSGNVLKKQAR